MALKILFDQLYLIIQVVYTF